MKSLDYYKDKLLIIVTVFLFIKLDLIIGQNCPEKLFARYTDDEAGQKFQKMPHVVNNAQIWEAKNMEHSIWFNGQLKEYEIKLQHVISFSWG